MTYNVHIQKPLLFRWCFVETTYQDKPTWTLGLFIGNDRFISMKSETEIFELKTTGNWQYVEFPE